MANQTNQKIMRESETIIVPHRSLTAYLGYNILENKQKFQSLEMKIISSRREKINEISIIY